MFSVSQKSVSQWEQGINRPTLEHLVAMSEKFGFTLDDFLKKKKFGDFLDVEG